MMPVGANGLPAGCLMCGTPKGPAWRGGAYSCLPCIGKLTVKEITEWWAGARDFPRPPAEEERKEIVSDSSEGVTPAETPSGKTAAAIAAASPAPEAPTEAPKNALEKVTAFLQSPALATAVPLLVVGYYALEQKVPNVDDAIAMVVLWCTRIGAFVGAVATLASKLRKPTTPAN